MGDRTKKILIAQKPDLHTKIERNFLSRNVHLKMGKRGTISQQAHRRNPGVDLSGHLISASLPILAASAQFLFPAPAWITSALPVQTMPLCRLFNKRSENKSRPLPLNSGPVGQHLAQNIATISLNFQGKKLFQIQAAQSK